MISHLSIRYLKLSYTRAIFLFLINYLSKLQQDQRIKLFSKFFLLIINKSFQMFIIEFFSPDKSSKRIPPLLIPIQQSTLIKPSSYLQELSYLHFKDYLSPFIRKQHLQLQKQNIILRPDHPLFIYCDFSIYINNILCIIKPCQQDIKRTYLLINSVVIIDKKKQQNNRFKERIIKMQEIEKIDKLVDKNSSVFIKGKQLKLVQKGSDGQIEQSRKWSDIIAEKTHKFESQNSCIYVLI